ncbi:MAG: SusC/RagA family TonB-linked outer membrane protein, partial [Prevotellaceae bacterium]|nr:SusC/RagA family TonB-linked outer membrane protein [Prevotellaceae bacterium]
MNRLKTGASCALLLLCLHVGGKAQSVTLALDSVTVKEAMEQLNQTHGYSFVFASGDVDTKKRVSVSVRSQPVGEAVRQILRGQDVAWDIKDKSIVVRKSPPPAPKPNELKGVVRDSEGTPIVGATVQVKGTTKGVMTGTDGSFALADVDANAKLVVSFMGYAKQEVPVNGRVYVAVALSEDAKAIDEVVVVGYGTQSSKLLTTSISKVKMDNIDQGNDSNPVKMLQGRVTGVSISASSGMPGSVPNVIIRGVGSISGNSAPLYVVDGIPSEKYPNINPNDIESMEVLKDASAAAIYGSRANTGVVLITTKSGRSGKTVINVSGRTGLGVIAQDITMANASEYATAMQAAVDNYNVQMRTNLKFYTPPTMENTDWVGLISRDIAYSQNASASISGGGDKTTFYASYGYNNQEGYLLKSSYNQNTLRAKLGHQINDIFKLNLNLAGAFSQQDVLEEESTSLKVLRTAREEQPWYSPYLDDGVSYKANGTMLTRHNPVMLINEEDWTKQKTQLSGVFSVDVTPFKGFKYTPSLSLYGIFDDETKKLSDRHDARKNNDGWSALTQQKDLSTRYVIDNIFSYDVEWDKLTASAMAGHSFEKYEYERFGARSENYANGAYPSSSFDIITAGANIYPGTVSFTGYALESYFGRIALNWDNRYIFNASLRSDGSSRFAKETRYGYFPSASLAWRASNEAFFAPLKSYINDLKLRLSWGQTGSMAGVGNFAA